MDKNKTKEDKTNLKQILNDSNTNIDTSLFDKTLRQIEETLENLGEKIDPKQGLEIKEKIIEENTNDNKEHVIDNTHLDMEKLHNLSSVQEVKRESAFGFYTYLALTMGIIFAIYEVLNIYKILIISRYPETAPYIEYFYEVIEILAYVVMNIISFARNLF
jgi:hypothetical protein